MYHANSVDACPSCPRPSLSVSSLGASDQCQGCDNAFLPYYPEWPNMLPLPADTPMYSKFVNCHMGAFQWHTMRNIRVGFAAIGYRLHVGEVVRHGCGTFVHNIDGRRTDTLGSVVRMRMYSHNHGMDCYRFGRTLPLPLPSHCRIVCLDVRNVRRCSVTSVALHLFVWPRHAREAKKIVRTLCANHCKWTDVLVVRGWCVSTYTHGNSPGRRPTAC